MPSNGSLRRALIGRVAAQWIALGGQLEGPAEGTAVDIEGLIVATAQLGPESDSRVYGVAIDWCALRGQVVNVARLRRVATELAGDARLGILAATVARAGGPRWPFTGASLEIESRNAVLVRQLVRPSQLMWRLRSAFGVSSRADIIGVLLLEDGPLTVGELARRTRFGKRNIAGAVEGMALAGVLEVERVGNQDRVQLGSAIVRDVWWPRRGRGWVDWVARWHVGLVVLEAADRTADATDAVRAVECRAAAESVRGAAIAGDLPRPDLSVTGVPFAEAYRQWTDALAHAFGGTSATE